MKPRDPLADIEVGIQGDTAISLGNAGRKLLKAVAEFRAAQSTATLYAAADALWSYVVQREAIGLTDHSKVGQVFGVTEDIWRLMGATFKASGGETT